MPIDPFAMPNPFGDPFGLGPTPLQQLNPTQTVPPLSPAEEEGLFSKIGSGALHGLGWIGGVLDKTFGGRAIRGGLSMLQGKATPTSELLSFLPGSDTLGLTNAENSVSGAELLGGHKDTPLLSAEGIGGLAAELLLDPSTYLTLGSSALTGLGAKAAKAGIKPLGGAARAAGLFGDDAAKLARALTLGERAGPVLPKAIADVTGKSLGGHLGIGLPFMGNAATFDLSKPLEAAGRLAGSLPGASYVSSAANRVGEVLDPLKRGFSSLFDANVDGQIDPVLQDVAKKRSGEMEGALFANRGKMTGLTEEMQRLAGWVPPEPGMPAGPWTAQMQAKANELGKQLRFAVERTPTPLSEATQAIANATPPNVIADILAGNVKGIAPEVVEAIQAAKEYGDVTRLHAPALAGANLDPRIVEMAKRARGVFDEQLAADRAAGFLTEPLKKPGVAGPEYATRGGTQFEGGAKGGVRQTQLPAEEVAKRDKLLGNLFTEGEGSVNWLTGTPEGRAIQQLDPQLAKQEVLKKMFGWSNKELDEFVALQNKQLQTIGGAGETRLTELLKKERTPVQTGPWNDVYQRERTAGKTADEAMKLADAAAAQEWAHTGSKFGGQPGQAAEYIGPKGDKYTIDVAPQLVQGGQGNQVALRVTATDASGKEVGRVLFDRRGKARGGAGTAADYTAAGLSVDAAHQKQGLTNAMYDYLAEQLKTIGPNDPNFGRILPSDSQTATTLAGGAAGGGKAIWERNAERAAKNFQKLSNMESGELSTLLKQKSGAITADEGKRLAALQAIQDQAGGLVDWQRKLDLGALEQTGGFFGNHFFADMERYLENRGVNRLNAGAAYEAIPRLATADPTAGVPVLKVLEQLGLSIDQLPQQFRGMYIPEEQARSLTSWIKPSVAPVGAQPWLQAIDSVTNLTKAGQTSWPATQARNILSDTFNRFAYGGSPISPLIEAKTFREGGVVPGIAQKIGMEGLSDAEATQSLAREMFQLGIMDTKKFQTADFAGANPLLQTQARGMPLIGVPPKGLADTLKSHVPGLGVDATWGAAINPLETRGVAGRAESKFLPVAAAQTTQNYAEEMNRIATYIDARSRGYNPLAAMQEVTKAHLDFGNLAPFERDVMRRLVPFYSWSRQNLPNVVGEIAQNPGGRMAQTMKLLNAGTDQGFLPENITQTGYAVPFGQDDRGRQNYLTSLGLPFEDIANLTSWRNLMGSTSPFVRLPYELATGTQTFTGQSMPATYPIQGNPMLNAFLMNSPLSRVFTTYRAGERALEGGNYFPAASQFLAGPRITSVDPLAARREAVRQLADERLGTQPEFSRFERLSVRPGQLPNLTPQELQLLQLYNAVNRRQAR